MPGEHGIPAVVAAVPIQMGHTGGRAGEQPGGQTANSCTCFIEHGDGELHGNLCLHDDGQLPKTGDEASPAGDGQGRVALRGLDGDQALGAEHEAAVRDGEDLQHQITAVLRRDLRQREGAGLAPRGEKTAAVVALVKEGLRFLPVPAAAVIVDQAILDGGLLCGGEGELERWVVREQQGGAVGKAAQRAREHRPGGRGEEDAVRMSGKELAGGGGHGDIQITLHFGERDAAIAVCVGLRAAVEPQPRGKGGGEVGNRACRQMVTVKIPARFRAVRRG